MLIIPDIHGRTFWKDAIKGHEEDDIIFLGDYVDPYNWENIERDSVLTNLEEIIEFKKKHMSNVTLLLGNHDFGRYIDGYDSMPPCRHDYINESKFRKLFGDNLSLFKIAVVKEIAGQKFSFSHATVTRNWVNKMFSGLSEPIKLEALYMVLNDWLTSNPKKLVQALYCIGFLRGGRSSTGSIVWSDYREHYEHGYEFDGYYEIFGHTQQEEDPVVTKWFANLDCRRAFILNDDGVLTELDGSPIRAQEIDGYDEE